MSSLKVFVPAIQKENYQVIRSLSLQYNAIIMGFGSDLLRPAASHLPMFVSACFPAQACCAFGGMAPTTIRAMQLEAPNTPVCFSRMHLRWEAMDILYNVEHFWLDSEEHSWNSWCELHRKAYSHAII